MYAAGFLPVVYKNDTILPGTLFSVWNIFQIISGLVSRLARVSGSHAAGGIIVHTIQEGRFRFDRTVQLTAVCGHRKEGAVMVFILSKIKCFFCLL